MELDAIFRLMDRAEQSSFSKVEVQTGELRLVLERGFNAPTVAPQTALVPNQETAEPEAKDVVRSPISGVFYLAKEPGAEPFVSAGAREKGAEFFFKTGSVNQAGQAVTFC